MTNNEITKELVGVTRVLVEVVHNLVHRESISEYQGSDTTYPYLQRTLTDLAKRLDSLASTFE